MFQIGDRVKWSSRFGSEKEGTVSHIVPANTEPRIVVGGIGSEFYRKNKVHFGLYFSQRDHESYIALTDPGKRGGKPSAYRPLVKNLQLVAKAENIK